MSALLRITKENTTRRVAVTALADDQDPDFVAHLISSRLIGSSDVLLHYRLFLLKFELSVSCVNLQMVFSDEVLSLVKFSKVEILMNCNSVCPCVRA